MVVFILARIPWHDTLHPGEGESVRGTILTEEQVFRPDDGGADVPLPEPGAEAGPTVTPGLLDILDRSRKRIILLCFLLFGPVTTVTISRWWYLLRTVGIPVRWLEALRLTYIGFFFNSAVPGLTGGDVVKAFYAARQSPGARVRAFMSVFIDRVIGLFALGLLAGGMLLTRFGDGRLTAPAVIVFLFLGISAGFGAVFLSRRLRRLLRIETLIRKLPFSHLLTEVDRAVVVYRDHPRAVLLSIGLSLVNHICFAALAVGMGHALGIQAAVHHYLILVPVCMMMASIPALPGGWGVREIAFAGFFSLIGVPGAKAVALSVLLGLSQLGWSLLGGVFFLLRPDRASRAEVRQFADAVETEVSPAET
jgi:uncharacterized protein (TIRG00374 family)